MNNKQNLMKDVISAVIKSHKKHRVTSNRHFFYDIYSENKNPLTRNTATRQIVDDNPFDKIDNFQFDEVYKSKELPIRGFVCM